MIRNMTGTWGLFGKGQKNKERGHFTFLSRLYLKSAMTRRAISHSILNASNPSKRVPSRRFSAISLPFYHVDFNALYSTSASISTTSNTVQDPRFRNLKYSLETDASASYVWGNYTSLLNSLGSEPLPLELHQQVLRRCTPGGEQHRLAIRRRITAGTLSQPFHEHEIRFQTVIQNIRSLGVQPTLDDYNFILDQFAAVGYYEGALNVYQELKRNGHIPDYKTFGLCFRAIAYRYTLPIPHDKREELLFHTQDVFKFFMDDMQKYQVAITAANMDLIFRILKETLDREGFESLLRWSYGIDLSNPDRLALEYGESSQVTDGAPPRVPLPFSTSALNTTLDLLGQFGDISKLVQAFEVLTQPLPQANQHFFNSFEADEDDDFGVAVDVASSSRIPLPHASPNTTTYNLLLRHICRQDHAILARHYLIQAIRLDRATSWTLKHMVAARRNRNKLHELPAPHFAISRLMLLPVMGEANKDKNLGLMKWLATKIPYIVKKQKADLEFYEPILAQMKKDNIPMPPVIGRPTVPTVLNVNVDDPSPPEAPKTKYFNIELHVQILKRNIAEMQEFHERLEFVLARTTQRSKERMGRRVWSARDVFLRDEGKRKPVTKETWREVVNFRPMKEEHENMRKAHRKMSTITQATLGAPTRLMPPISTLWQLPRFTQP
ncbi:hypothetical protein BDZ97DRAFT_1775296 [Flammula alnicola]|nr:hypothetical protein BDZ97DRAFT_1775296 [Flammula alnicola]